MVSNCGKFYLFIYFNQNPKSVAIPYAELGSLFSPHRFLVQLISYLLTVIVLYDDVGVYRERQS